MSDLAAIKSLRGQTGISLTRCRAALAAANGDLEKALIVLRGESAVVVRKKADLALGAGLVRAYIHNDNALGSLVRLDCETDFVAKNPDFITFADDLAMHIAAFAPIDKEELLTQAYIRDPGFSVAEVLKSMIQKFGERIELGDFFRLILER